MNPMVEAPAPDLVGRVRAEFIEMPGLTLTVAQAQRLWGLDRSMCERVIDTLTESGFLVWTRGDAVMARGEMTAPVSSGVRGGSSNDRTTVTMWVGRRVGHHGNG
jgi:hypothetical protein